MGNAAYIIFIMWNSISGLDTRYHFRFNISCGVAVMMRGHQKKHRYFLKGGEGGYTKIFEGRANLEHFEISIFLTLTPLDQCGLN